MSLSPYTPQMAVSNKVKSFWSRPEGKLGVALGAIALLGIAYVSLPFILTILAGAITAGIMSIEFIGIMLVLIGILWFLFTDNPPKRMVISLYKMACRWVMGWIIELDPIAILNNKIADMKKAVAKVDGLIEQFRGAWQKLVDTISRNEVDIKKSLSRAAQADKIASASTSPLEQQKMMLQRGVDAAHAARVKQQNDRLQLTANKLDATYNKLIRMQTAAKATEQDTEFRIKEMINEKEAMDVAGGVISTLRKVFKGNDFDQEMYDATVEFVQNDISAKIGMIDDFSRSMEDVLTNMDLDNGVVQDEGLKMLDAFQNHITTGESGIPMLTAGTDGVVPANMPKPQAVAVPVGASKTNTKKYFD